MLREGEDRLADDRISALISLLQDRKREYVSHPAPIVSLIGLRELERFVHFGLIGRVDLPPPVKMERSLAARAEVTRIAELRRCGSGRTRARKARRYCARCCTRSEHQLIAGEPP